MKKYEVYRNIRKRAMIMGLPISHFALMMVSVISSLLVIIFSFSFGVIVVLLVTNTFLYGVLVRWAKTPQLLSVQKVFPRIISNKKLSPLSYA
ncbi:hypothetical protein V1387_05020 [Allomuricauda taeanensis]|uniref:hypothetical protein n=1 Tax=Flagellimonas taeanensis TaxID=1005926 RepID=UPI002E7BE3D0|nr:hypothetical protein [Allomuricauda taeanensis]MEE1962038.1 hypothetical protein [Allomuricauda taeanensis]